MEPSPQPVLQDQTKKQRLMKIEGNKVTIAPEAALKAFGSSDEDFINGLLAQLINVGSPGKTIDEEGSAFVASIVKGIEPQDQIEAMLGSQMAAVHLAAMTFARRLAHCETIGQQASAECAFNKLTRTFTAQMEALKKYRTGGQQHVTVRHVTVNEGGQAIVGSVTTGGGIGGKK